MRDIDVPSSTRARRAERGLIAWVVAVCGAVLLTAAIPMTSSAFTAIVTDSRNAAAAKPVFTCADTFSASKRKQRAYFQYAFGEPAGTSSAVDSSDAHNTGTYEGTNGKDGVSPIACPNDGGGAYALDGSSRVLTAQHDGPFSTGFTEEVWFKASSAGKIMGYEIERSGESSNYDKHLYIDSRGYLQYGTDGNGVQTLDSGRSLLDGTWHLAVATTSPTDGSVLYVDGAVVKSDPTMVSGESFDGYWRIGEGKLSGWPYDPGRRYFTGSLRYAAAYPFVLSAQEVASDWSIGRPGPSVVGPTATATPESTATITATPVGTATPIGTATATPVGSDTPAPTSSASATAVTGPTGGRASAAPAPESSDISTAQNG